jgi:type II secretory pathway pseudopilin PulG
MIVIAIIAIILALALPVYSNYTIRAKVAEGLAVAANAKTATSDTCQSEPDIASLTNTRAGYGFGGSTYIESIEISGSCLQPLITVTTRNTGATPSPIFRLTGDNSLGSGRISWTCRVTLGENIHVPMTCRS